VMDVEEIYKINPKEIATRTFGTPDKNPDFVKKPFDEGHYGWLIYRCMNKYVIAGKWTIVNEPTFIEPYDRFWLPPYQCRLILSKVKKWKICVAHQSRNAPHVGHEMLMKHGCLMVDEGVCDGILVNAVVGSKKPQDFIDEIILEGYEAIGKYGFIKPQKYLVTFVLWDFRYSGALESILHAIIRQNMGCTHHIFGRNHACDGSYMHENATYKLWTHGLPSIGLNEPPHIADKGVKIKPILMDEFWYCPVCQSVVYGDFCNHGKYKIEISGSKIRQLINNGMNPPISIIRPEVYNVIIKWSIIFDSPFVNTKYLKFKNDMLEVF